MPEIVEDGVTGFICDHRAELAQAIGSVDRLDPRACRGRVRRHFDTDQMAAAYAVLYQELCWGGTRAAYRPPAWSLCWGGRGPGLAQHVTGVPAHDPTHLVIRRVGARSPACAARPSR
ncbi:hypothetical protein GCM10010104_24970 [Streptomyces indiaensis]|uniref:Glycosyl transferase family 1 n=1 Tax=Streptomyces indiaensis TaxID=284033 RepID=A0ABN3DHS3_9ACTN